MAFGRGDSVGFRGGRGGLRGGRGRGGGTFQRGRGRGGGTDARGRGRGGVSTTAATAPRPSKVPTAFRVISHADDSDDDDGGAHGEHTTTQARDDRTALQRPRSLYPPADNDDDDDAPPTAVSARSRNGTAGEPEEEAESAGRRAAAARHPLPQRGRGVGGDRGRGRGNLSAQRQHPQRGALPVERRGKDEESRDADAAAGAAHAPTKVITTVTDVGTELPARLNSKVFIDGLPWTYDEPGKPSLEDELIQFALAWKVGRPLKLIKKPGQGFGFLVFKSPHSVDTAVRVLNGRKFLGRTLRVEEPKPRDLENMKDIAALRDVGKDSFTRQVLLTDLNKVAQPEIIREVLRDVAPQLEKKLETIKMTSQNRKAFLTFASEADVEPAVTLLDGFHRLGRKVGAVRAAPPGSLSYSRSAHGGGKVPLETSDTISATSAAAAHGQAEVSGSGGLEEEDTIVPLGADPAPSTAARGKTKPQVQPAAVAASAKGSNVTGKTAKYDLLDKGPREVYVGNLGDHITAQQLQEHLAPCGAITACELLVHPQTHLATGIARVEFALPAYAAYAKNKYHGSRLRGCVLRVDRGDEASAPLASEAPAPSEQEAFDEDRYMAERYGVQDKEAYFKGTSFESEYAAGSGEGASSAGKKRGRAEGQRRSAGSKAEGKREAAASEPAKKMSKVSSTASPALGRVTGADLDNDSDNDEGIDFIFGGDVPSEKFGAKRRPARAAADNVVDDDDDDEEHFFDVDSTPVREYEGKDKGKTKGRGKDRGAAQARGRGPKAARQKQK